MARKNKQNIFDTDRLNSLAMQAGLVLMTGATVFGMIELPEHPNKVIVPTQPTFAMASNTDQAGEANPLRREREETAPHFISYSANQRTPGRTGRF